MPRPTRIRLITVLAVSALALSPQLLIPVTLVEDANTENRGSRKQFDAIGNRHLLDITAPSWGYCHAIACAAPSDSTGAYVNDTQPNRVL